MTTLDQQVLNILYTPLDIPETPAFDYAKLIGWVKTSTDQQVAGRRDASQITNPTNYPWNIVYAKLEGRWHNGFQQQFPELAEYFSSAYGLDPAQIKNIVLLPVKNDFVGTGFWHSDPDESGLRMYLENDEIDNFLLIRPTTVPYDRRPEGRVITDDGISADVQTDVEHSAKLLKRNQGFFINNVRAVHAARTSNPRNKRIAVIISLLGRGSPLSSATDATKQLIIDSAKKYKDYSVHWTPPKE